MTDADIPQESCLDDAVSYTKGCFVGQEIVARMHNYRAKPSKQLKVFTIEGKPFLEKGAPLFDSQGKEAGVITSVAFVPTRDEGFALGYVKRDFAECEHLLIKTGGTVVLAEVQK